MKKRTTVVAILLSGLSALLISGSAMADWSWDFTGTYPSGARYSSMTFSGSGGAPDVTATGWSNATEASRSSSDYGSGNLISRDIARWNGLGVYSREDGGQPSHATDNNRRIDSILLNFGSTAVTLEQVQFGYFSGDSDFSLAAYTGGGSTDLSSMEYSDLASNGWSTIGSYYNSRRNVTSVNSGGVASSYWLISALNPYIGGPGSSSYYANDYFKLASVGGTSGPSNEVPEPSTLLLLGGVLLIMAMRRRTGNQGESGHALQA